MKATIAVLAGDGVGQEIVPEAVAVLKAVGQQFGHTFEFTEAPVGGQAIDKTGMPLPPKTLALAKKSHAVLLGAVGGPKWEGLDYAIRPERALLGLREQLGLYANLRPARLYSMLADASTLKREVVEGIDILVVRELTGGISSANRRGSGRFLAARRGSIPRSIRRRRSGASPSWPSKQRGNDGRRSCPWTRPTCWNPPNYGAAW
jgi:3-isopropylmalate dehydrogenase